LANYLRPARNDHRVLLQLLSENQLEAGGLVVDPVLVGRHSELLTEAGRHGLETVLDPRSIDLSTPAGFQLSGVAALPWAPLHPHTPEELAGPAGLLLAEELAEFAVQHELSSVLAPTHIIEDLNDPWLDVDARLIRDLRRALDSRGRARTPIYYPLTVRSKMFADVKAREVLIERLGDIPTDGIWLRIHPFGTTSAGPLALRRYVEACQDLHELNVPLVAEHTGTVGVPLLAFGAVGGIESGLTLGERFDLSRYTRLDESNGKGFLPPPRVYLHSLGAFVSRDQATSFFGRRGMQSAHGCNDQRCCRHGWQDMVEDPRRHFVIRRNAEIAALSRVPPQLRANVYMNDFLRPASDAAVRAERAEPALASARKRLDSWRGALDVIADRHADRTVALAPTGERAAAR
jgi:hypothetical protein